MPSQIPPEIYQHIGRMLIRPEDPKDSNRRRDQQGSLARMMRATKNIYEVCRADLYQNCLVGDINAFVGDIHSNPQKIDLLNQIEHLALHQMADIALTDPSYAQLMIEDEWVYCGVRKPRGNVGGALGFALHNEEFTDQLLFEPAYDILLTAMAEAKKQSRTIFSNLERVTMPGPQNSWIWGFDQDEIDSFHTYIRPAPLPHFFINLPSVKHYCQGLATGPLALSHDIIKLEHPPEIVTIHPGGMLDEWGPSWSPPIVLGAINRFMCDQSHSTTSRTDDGSDLREHELSEMLRHVKRVFHSIRDILIVPRKGFEHLGFERKSPSSVSLEGTTVELYDYVRHNNSLRGKPWMAYGDQCPPGSLAYLQARIDEHLGRWKGKVVLRNREECPPCSACGFRGHAQAVIDVINRVVPGHQA